MVVAEHLVDGLVEHELDLLVGPCAVDHDRRGAELLATVDEVDLAREAADEGRLLEGGVSAADDGDDPVTEERRVAGGAVRDAAALEPGFRLEPDLPRVRAGGDDDAVGDVLVAAHEHLERALGEVDAGDVVGEELRSEALGLAAEVLHHRRPHDAVGVPGVVLDVRGDHQLAAPVETLDHEWVQVRASGVQRCRVAGRAASDDDHVAYVAHGVFAPWIVLL